MSRPSPDAILAGLDPDQLAAVTSTAPVVRVIAGAGSGKTRVLTRRIAHRVASEDIAADGVRVITFTRRAAAELRARLGALGLSGGIAASTFHAAALAEMTERWTSTGQRRPGLVTSRIRLLRRLELAPAGDVEHLAHEIDWAKARGITPEAYADAASAARRARAATSTARRFARYEKHLAERGMIDFDDLLTACTDALRTDPSHARSVRWRSRHVFVDEFQDLNPIQFALLAEWVGPEPDLFVVGDPAQAIYGWNGGDPRYLTELQRWFPDVATVNCPTNYRCSPTVVHVARAALGSAGLGAPLAVSAAEEGPIPQIRRHVDPDAEAAAVARSLRDRQRPGATWSEQAVLARTNAQLSVIARALERAGIPATMGRSDRVVDRPVGAAVLEVCNGPARPLSTLVVDLASGALSGPSTANREGASPDEAATRDDIDRCLDAARELSGLNPTATTRDFVSWLRELTDRDAAPNGVALLTFHAAKGLEWPIVHLVGVEDGLVPSRSARGARAESEERRLFYVACTRASHDLEIHWSGRRRTQAGDVERDRSPFLDEVEAAITSAQLMTAPAAPPGRPWRNAGPADKDGSSATQPLQLDLEADVDEAHDAQPTDREVAMRLQLLDNWRATMARAVRVRPSHVLSDDAMEAIALSPPAGPDELAQLPGVGPVRAPRLWGRLPDLAPTP